MHAVVRETYYDPDRPIQDRDEFKKFQSTHAEQSGYVGTVVVNAGSGRFLTVTLWRTDKESDAARTALGRWLKVF